MRSARVAGRSLAGRLQRQDVRREGMVPEEEYQRLKDVNAQQASQMDRQQTMIAQLRVEMQESKQSETQDIVNKADTELQLQQSDVKVSLLQVEKMSELQKAAALMYVLEYHYAVRPRWLRMVPILQRATNRAVT